MALDTLGRVSPAAVFAYAQPVPRHQDPIIQPRHSIPLRIPSYSTGREQGTALLPKWRQGTNEASLTPARPRHDQVYCQIAMDQACILSFFPSTGPILDVNNWAAFNDDNPMNTSLCSKIRAIWRPTALSLQMGNWIKKRGSPTAQLRTSSIASDCSSHVFAKQWTRSVSRLGDALEAHCTSRQE